MQRLPYPGLRPFDQDESDLFFGREEQIGEIQKRLQAHHLAAVLGGSGSGKSSLIRAGVIPNLRAYGIEAAGDFWIPVIFTPQTAPIRRLAVELDCILETPSQGEGGRQERIDEIADLLAYPTGLTEFRDHYRDQIKVEPGLEALRDDVNILVLADQFEEIFRPHPNPRTLLEVRQLVDLVVETYKHPDPGTYLILTMRTEDLHRCAAYLELPIVLNQCAFLTRRLTEVEFRNAMVNPALLMQERGFTPLPKSEGDGPFSIEVLKLVYDDLARHSADPDQLPLLQHFLFQVWAVASRRCAGVPTRILKEDLVNAVGVGHPLQESLLSRCIENAADVIYASLTPRQQDIARTTMELLADVDDSGVYKRRWTTRQEIAEVAGLKSVDDPDLATVIERFRLPHPYLRVEGTSAGAVMDVFHEAFLRNWPLFETWISDERRAAKAYLRLVDSYQYWSRECADEKRSQWARLYSRGFHTLGQRGLIEAVDTGILKKNPAWAARYSGGEDSGSALYANAVRYARRSRVQKRVKTWGSVGAVVLFMALAVWFLNVQEVAEFLVLEKRVFQPFTVSAMIRAPNMQTQPAERIEPGLWEVAVSLRTLSEFERELADAETGALSEMDERRGIRLRSSSHLAQFTSYNAARSLLDGYLWPLREHPKSNAQSETRMLVGAGVTADERSLLTDQCGAVLEAGAADRSPQPDALTAARVFSPYAMGERATGLPFEIPEAQRVRIYMVSDKLCFLATADGGGTWSKVFETPLPPGTTEVELDPAFRFYMSKGQFSPPGTETVVHQAHLVPLQWYRKCDAVQADSCTEFEWRVQQQGVPYYLQFEQAFDLWTNSEDIDGYTPFSYYEARSRAGEALAFYNTGWSHRFRPINDDGGLHWKICLSREAVQPKDAPVMSTTYKCDGFAVRVDTVTEDNPLHGQRGLNEVTILPLEPATGGDPASEVPLAELTFMGPSVDFVRLSEAPGHIRLTAAGTDYVAAWGREALLEQVCSVLDKAGWHDPARPPMGGMVKFSIVAERFRNSDPDLGNSMSTLWDDACSPTPGLYGEAGS